MLSITQIAAIIMLSILVVGTLLLLIEELKERKKLKHMFYRNKNREIEQLAARLAHNQQVAGSNPALATKN